jgi:uncharacterized protein YndB with AHSA1/START domain
MKATTSITIHAPASKVWKALTDPKLIKRYLFGADVHTDWKTGSPIRYTGVYEGKEYEERGEILKIEPERILQATNFSSMSGKEDKPENYAVVTYQLQEEGASTTLTITQDNIPNQQGVEHSEANWRTVLESLRLIVEHEK